MPSQNQALGLQMSIADQTKYIKKMKPIIQAKFNTFCSNHSTLAFAYAGKTEQTVKRRLSQHKKDQPVLFNNSLPHEIIKLPKLKPYCQADVHAVMSQLEGFLIQLTIANYPAATHHQQQTGGDGQGGNHNPGNMQKLYIMYRA